MVFGLLEGHRRIVSGFYKIHLFKFSQKSFCAIKIKKRREGKKTKEKWVAFLQ